MPTILGAGISGLSAAYYLTKKKISPISIFEASNRIGGWIKTEKHLDKGFVFEQGPRTIRPKGPAGRNTLELIEDVGLSDFIIPIKSNEPAAKNRMIYAKQQLCALPTDFYGLFKTMPPFSKPLVYHISRDLFVKSSIKEDESIYDFTERRFGSEVANYAISPLICGICAGDAKEISVKFLMKDIFANEQKYGGVIKGMMMDMIANRKKKDILKPISGLAKQAKLEKWNVYSMNGGLELLPYTLGAKLKENNVSINLSTYCKEISFRRGKAYLTLFGHEKEFVTDYLISSIPSYKLSKLLLKQHPSLACDLRDIPYVDVGIVNIQYDSADILSQKAFGFLAPPCENLPLLGVIFDSCCFNMRGNTVLTVMLGGKWFIEKFGHCPTQKNLLDVALDQVQNILKIKQAPKLVRVNILKKCIPQYVVGHQARLDRINRYIATQKLPLALCGAAYDGVGVNDVIFSARNAADALEYHTTNSVTDLNTAII